MSFSLILSIAACLVLVPAMAFAADTAADAAEPPIRAELRALDGRPVLPDWQKQAGATTRPSSPRRFLANDYHAVPDGQTVCTRQIQQAIDACSAAGGGTVEFAPGDYVTGALFLKSYVDLHIARDVRLLGAQEDDAFPLVHTRAAGIETDWPAALLNVRDQHNVSITGEGALDARGKRWWDRFWAAVPDYEKRGLRWAVDYDIRRPHFVQVYQSRDVTVGGGGAVGGLTFLNSPFWTFDIVFSRNVTVDGVTIRNNVAASNGPSTDGINIDSSAFVLVQNCDVDCNDDAYSFKSGMNADGLRINLPCQYSLFRDCIARRAHGGITFGSDMSGGIRHVQASGMKFIGTTSGIRLKSASVRGGTVEDVLIRDIQMTDVATAIEISLNWFPKFSYPRLPEGATDIPPVWRILTTPVPPEKATPTFRDFTMRDVKATGSKTGIAAEGLPNSPARNFHLERVTIDARNAGSIRYARDWTTANVRIIGQDGAPVAISDCEGVAIDSK